jgi:SAM-dependent methyltransferase
MKVDAASPNALCSPIPRWRERALELIDFPLGRVLDFGCGDGAMLVTAAERGARCFGIDVRPEAIAEARRRLPQATLRLIGIDDSIPFPDAHFDTVLMIEVLEHVPDERAALQEIARILRPGGRLILTTPHDGLLTFLDVGNFKFAFPRTHRFVHTVLLGHSGEYQMRFQPAEHAGLIGDISVPQHRRAWHRHYSPAQVRRFVPPSLVQQRCAIYFPAMRAMILLRKALLVATRGRLDRLRRWLLTIERRLSRVRSHWGDQLVMQFFKREQSDARVA